jgi:hypothetical protein
VNTQTGDQSHARPRQRNDNRNVSASPSVARSRRTVGNGGMARSHRNAKQESKRKLVKQDWVGVCRYEGGGEGDIEWMTCA